MTGRGINSEYLITRLLSMDYFHFQSKPVLFVAYFFPFIAYGKNRPYFLEEMDEKIDNIRNNKHGNFYNYATQGFGNVCFFQQNVSFDYFYERLCSYDSEKYRWFNSDILNDSSLESDSTRKDLFFVIDKKHLLLKRGYEVSDFVKKQLISDLANQEVKYVLAKILYYIISDNHILPNVVSDKRSGLLNKLNFQFSFNPNVCLGFRKDMDEDKKIWVTRLKKAKLIQVCCLDGVSLFGSDISSVKSDESIYDILESEIKDEQKPEFEIIISDYRSDIYHNATNYQINFSHAKCSKIELLKKVSCKLTVLSKNYVSGFTVKNTSQPIPYSLFIVSFYDEKYDYIKLDLYSPFVLDNKERPCLYIFRETDPMLFAHFKGVFERMWKNDEYSSFINLDMDV